MRLKTDHKPKNRYERQNDLFIFAQPLTGHLNGLQPKFQLRRHLRSLCRLRIRLEQLVDIAIGQTLLGQGDGTHETISECDKLLLQIDGLVVPPDESRLYLIRMENGYGATITNTAGTLHGATAALTHKLVQIGQRIEMEAGKVQFAQVACIVHVPQKDIHILRRAQTVDRCRIRNFALALQQTPAEHGEDAAYEVIHIPHDIEHEKSHKPRHVDQRNPHTDTDRLLESTNGALRSLRLSAMREKRRQKPVESESFRRL